MLYFFLNKNISFPRLNIYHCVYTIYRKSYLKTKKNGIEQIYTAFRTRTILYIRSSALLFRSFSEPGSPRSGDVTVELLRTVLRVRGWSRCKDSGGFGNYYQVFANEKSHSTQRHDTTGINQLAGTFTPLATVGAVC